MQDRGIAVFRIGKNLADSLAGADLVAGFYIYLAQITVNGQVVTVTYDDRVVIARNNEHAGYFAIEYSTGISSRSSLNVDTAIVGTYIF